MLTSNLINGHSFTPLSPLTILRSTPGPSASSSSSTSRRNALDGAAVIVAAKSTLIEIKCEWGSCKKILNCWNSYQKACFFHSHFQVFASLFWVHIPVHSLLYNVPSVLLLLEWLVANRSANCCKVEGAVGFCFVHAGMRASVASCPFWE